MTGSRMQSTKKLVIDRQQPVGSSEERLCRALNFKPDAAIAHSHSVAVELTVRVKRCAWEVCSMANASREYVPSPAYIHQCSGT